MTGPDDVSLGRSFRGEAYSRSDRTLISIFESHERKNPMDARIRTAFTKTFSLITLATVLAGCASTQETSTIQQSVSMLYDRQMALERRLESTEGKARSGGDLYARLEEVQMRIGSLNGRIEELEHKLDLLQKMSPQASSTPASPPVAVAPQAGNTAMEAHPQAQVPARPQPMTTGPASAAVQRPPQAAPAAPPPPASAPPAAAESPDKVAFDRASQLFQQGKFEPARKEFQNIATRYPKSEYADNALFNVGECYLSEKRYQDAIETYQQVMDKYPRGDKAPQALLKQGTAFQQIGDATAAKIIFERLVEKYPGTPAAQAAEKKLKQMP